MKLANYRLDGQNGVGIISGVEIVDVSNLSKPLAEIRSVDDILSKGLLGRAEEEAKRLPTSGTKLASVSLLSPILNPEKIMLAAVNYYAHGKEQNVLPPAEPYFFTKFRNCIVGPGGQIIAPRVSKKVDWEVELAVVIGRKGKYIKREDAMEYVAGYTVANDISFRDLQIPAGWPQKPSSLGQNWLRGKALDGTFPMGPWLVTTNEIKDPHNLTISLSVNGVVRQNSSTADMVFGVDQLIEYLSSGMTLSPGDIISTGTPPGVALFTGAPFLKDGDIVEATIEKIGTLRNVVKREEL